jgi:NADH-quinone oxidoreductase subunit C
MSDAIDSLAGLLTERFGSRLARLPATAGELTFEVAPAELVAVCRELRDEPAFAFEVLADLSGIDYLHFGLEEWQTEHATATGFSRGVRRGADEIAAAGTSDAVRERRFAVAYHLLSITHNRRLRLRAYCEGGEPPMLPTVTTVWAGADWFEREVFDLFGVLFHGHPDLRRLLTDYGFIGHPFRKDFPLSGHVEVRYDPERKRVLYQPVSIEPRTLVPRVIRDADHRYDPLLTAAPVAGKPNA